jgi:hypothetical protein
MIRPRWVRGGSHTNNLETQTHKTSNRKEIVKGVSDGARIEAAQEI